VLSGILLQSIRFCCEEDVDIFSYFIIVGVAWEWQPSFGVSLNSVQQAKAKTSKNFPKFCLLI
jgi:hypothetical protein